MSGSPLPTMSISRPLRPPHHRSLLSAAASDAVLPVVGGHVHGAGAVAGSVGFAGLAGMDVTALVLALTAWITMTVAMMLVTVLPMLTVARSLLPRRSHRSIMLILGVATFVTVWLAVGAALIVNSAALQALSRQWSWLAANPNIVAGVVLVAAGAYQFSRLKNGCLRACRQPHRFAVAHWRGVRPVPVEVMAMTGAYAASCVGCSWALMMACLAVGPAASFPVMIGVCAVDGGGATDRLGSAADPARRRHFDRCRPSRGPRRRAAGLNALCNAKIPAHQGGSRDRFTEMALTVAAFAPQRSSTPVPTDATACIPPSSRRTQPSAALSGTLCWFCRDPPTPTRRGDHGN